MRYPSKNVILQMWGKSMNISETQRSVVGVEKSKF